MSHHEPVHDEWDVDDIEWDWSEEGVHGDELALEPYDLNAEQDEPNAQISPNAPENTLENAQMATSEDTTQTSQEDSMKSRLLINPNKAGTQYTPKHIVAKIVYEASKGSPFFLAEQRRDALVTARIQSLQSRVQAIQTMDLRLERGIVESVLRTVEKEWEASERRWIDGGYVNLIDTRFHDPHKLCPDLILVRSNFDKYTAVSKKIREVFAMYDPQFSPMSLDEAYLDITDYLVAHPEHTPESVVSELRAEIFRRTMLTASAGIAANKMLAKAERIVTWSDINKPNGQKFLPVDRESIMEFVRTLPIRKVPGVGKVNERILKSLGIEMCGHLKEHLVLIYKLFSPIMFNFCIRTSLGVGSAEIESESERKSIGVERTFGPMQKSSEMYEKLSELSELLATDLKKHDTKGRTLTLKLKTTEFRLFTRAKTLTQFMSTAEEIFQCAQQILALEIVANPGLRLRLMGLSMSKLSSRSIDEDGIAKFLKRPSPSTPFPKHPQTSLTCPVCCKEFPDISERDMAEHVGRCLEDPHVPDGNSEIKADGMVRIRAI
ncbi:DNA-directed DNA polymerase [Spizellomyces sp. 'palustris']|nr:DNA-directed DNA polymerase [Spizellomyces sp. 'palustris']